MKPKERQPGPWTRYAAIRLSLKTHQAASAQQWEYIAVAMGAATGFPQPVAGTPRLCRDVAHAPYLAKADPPHLEHGCALPGLLPCEWVLLLLCSLVLAGCLNHCDLECHVCVCAGLLG